MRHLDMPRNFFSGNNCVAEYGQLPTNFLLGVSTPCSDIDFRRQMRSRLGEPITVAGNPPLKFASAAAENDQLPNFPLFLTRVLLNDFFSIGMLRVTEGLIFTSLYICSLRMGLSSTRQRAAGAVAHRDAYDLAQRRDQEGSGRQRLGRQSRDAFLVACSTSLTFSHRTASSSGAMDL